jgi:DNA-binding response OmpR family regulator
MIEQPAPEVETVAITKEGAALCSGTLEELSTGRETILFVEDEAFVREVTGEVLRAAGYSVLTAKDAAAARTYHLQHGAVDLLLTDVILPGENGRALAGMLRKSSPGLKVLFISGYAEQMRMQDAGSEICLAKPFSGGVLLRKVRQVLDSEDKQRARSGAPVAVSRLQNLGGNLVKRNHPVENA